MFNIKKSELVNESIYETTLPNGLKFIFIPKKGFTKQFAMYATNYGSNNIKFYPVGSEKYVEVPLGIAHFLEHKLFDNEDGSNVFQKFSEYGADPNAFTSYDMTAYHFTSTDGFYQNLETLINFVNNPYFTHESVEKEKGIIAQEITMYDDIPNWVIFCNFLAAAYHEHPVKNNVAGDIASITDITHEMLYLCYNNFYNPANMVLVICGDLEPQEVLENVLKCISQDKRKLNVGEVRNFEVNEPREVVKNYVETSMDVSRPKILYGFKDSILNLHGTDLLRRDLSVQIALDLLLGKSSQLYDELYNKQLIDDSFEYAYTAKPQYAFAEISVETENYEEFLTELKHGIAQAKKHGVSIEEFERIKKSYIGSIIRVFNNIENLTNMTVHQYFNGITVFDYYDVLNSITINDITTAFSTLYEEEYCVTSILKPTK